MLLIVYPSRVRSEQRQSATPVMSPTVNGGRGDIEKALESLSSGRAGIASSMPRARVKDKTSTGGTAISDRNKLLENLDDSNLSAQLKPKFQTRVVISADNRRSSRAKHAGGASLQSYEEYKKRQKLIERIVGFSSLLFVAVVVALVWISEGGEVMGSTVRFLQRIEEGLATNSLQPDINCADPKNASTPFCEDRKARIESTWRGITRFHKGKANPFALH